MELQDRSSKSYESSFYPVPGNNQKRNLFTIEIEKDKIFGEKFNKTSTKVVLWKPYGLIERRERRSESMGKWGMAQ